MKLESPSREVSLGKESAVKDTHMVVLPEVDTQQKGSLSHNFCQYFSFL